MASFARTRNVETLIGDLLDKVRERTADGDALPDGSVVITVTSEEQAVLLDVMLIAGCALQSCALLSFGDASALPFTTLTGASLAWPKTVGGCLDALVELRNATGPFSEFDQQFLVALERKVVGVLLEAVEFDGLDEPDEPDEMACPAPDPAVVAAEREADERTGDGDGDGDEAPF